MVERAKKKDRIYIFYTTLLSHLSSPLTLEIIDYQPQTLGGLYNVNDRLPRGTQTDVVYSLKCETCQDEYVGETMRALEVRSKEHRDAIRLNHPEKSAIAEHVLERNGSHDIDWTNVRMIYRATGMKERKVQEAFAIEERKPAMNRDKGLKRAEPGK